MARLLCWDNLWPLGLGPGMSDSRALSDGQELHHCHLGTHRCWELRIKVKVMRSLLDNDLAWTLGCAFCPGRCFSASLTWTGAHTCWDATFQNILLRHPLTNGVAFTASPAGLMGHVTPREVRSPVRALGWGLAGFELGSKNPASVPVSPHYRTTFRPSVFEWIFQVLGGSQEGLAAGSPAPPLTPQPISLSLSGVKGSQGRQVACASLLVGTTLLPSWVPWLPAGDQAWLRSQALAVCAQQPLDLC
ncbi:uncharacterized protein LOC104848330 [Fukomys damarensis]|uniref:uncharacterized protein LOC104848330 n=1 Tax=Fukomys damarensis TaxID=885580 RepID=UPI00053FE312|nr:uncharacterized protein LOC104848330 [Fukomys damarensis]